MTSAVRGTAKLPALLNGSTGLVKLKRAVCKTKRKTARIIFLAINAKVKKTIIVSNGLFGNFTGQKARLKRMPLVTGKRTYTYNSMNYLRRCTSASTLMHHFARHDTRTNVRCPKGRVGNRLVIRLCGRKGGLTARYLRRRYSCLKRNVTKFVGVFDPRHVIVKNKLSRTKGFCVRGVDQRTRHCTVPSYTIGARVVTTHLNGGTKDVKTTNLVFGQQ